MEWKFEYICENISPALVRKIADLDDESLKITLAGLICKLVGGLKSVPSKKFKTRLAKRLIEQGMGRIKTCELTGVAKSTYFKLKKEQTNGENQ